jgi:hypothetical protein
MMSQQQKRDCSQTGYVLKITENSVVSPALNNGLALLHLFDYCVPLVKLDLADQKPHHQRLVYTWHPFTTAKVHVAGITSILVG